LIHQYQALQCEHYTTTVKRIGRGQGYTPCSQRQEVVTEPVHKEEQEQIVVREVRTEQKTLPAPALQKLRAEENRKQVKAYIADYPEAKAKEIAIALSLSLPTVRKYMK
jgi:hypothetical protein